MTPVDPSEAPLVDQKIGDLGGRARKLRFQSNLFLGATILLLAMGAIFFYLAPRLTIQEIEQFGVLVQQKQDQIDSEQERLESLQAMFGQSRKTIADRLFTDRLSISKAHPKPPPLLLDVFFFSPETGWAVDDEATILATQDGGQTWTPQNSGTSTSLYSVHFISPEIGWIVGREGTILATHDGGQNWTSQNGGTENPLLSVQFISPEIGWVVGWGGTILATQDGGQTWASQSSGTEHPLLSAQFINQDFGWAVGMRGTILATADGGQTWTSQDSGTEARLYSVGFVGQEIGWPAGDEGTILSINSTDTAPVLQAATPDALIETVDAFLETIGETELPSDLRLNDQDLTLRDISSQTKNAETQISNLTPEISALQQVSAQSDGWTPFLTTTVSRVGILLLIVFLVSILVNLYRYNMRLAAFYNARADALGLADVFTDLRLDELVTTMAPTPWISARCHEAQVTRPLRSPRRL